MLATSHTPRHAIRQLLHPSSTCIKHPHPHCLAAHSVTIPHTIPHQAPCPVTFTPTTSRDLTIHTPLVDLERLLELDDQPPVVLGHLVLEVCLECVDRLARDARHQGVRVVKVAAKQARLLGRVGRLDLHGHALARARDVHRLVVELQGRDAAQVDAVLGRDAQRRAHLGDTLRDLHAQHDGVLLVEDAGGDDLEGAGEHGHEARRLLLLRLELLHVRRELVKQVVDDVRGEDLDAKLLGQLPRLLVHGDVERQDHRKLLGLLLVHHIGTQHVLLVHGPDVDARHRDVDLGGGQEGEQRLQRAQRRRLHAHALAALVHLGEDVGHVGHHRVLELLLAVLGAHHVHRRARHRLLQARSHDLDTHGRADLLVVHELPLDAHLAQHLRRLERLDARDYGPRQAAHHDLVALLELAVDEHAVHGGAQALHRLDLQHRALGAVDKHEAVRHHGLRELDHELQQVGDALARDGGRGHHVDVLAGVGVLPVQGHVQALLVELQEHLRRALLKLGHDVLLLALERVAHGRVGQRLPVVQAVNLVERDDEGRLAHLEQVDRLDGLLLQAVHEVHDEHRDVAQARATRAQVGERLVAGRVDHQQAGQLHVERAADAQRLGALVDGVRGHEGGTNLLRDAARLAVLHVGAADVVQDLGLADIDVAQDTADGGAQDLLARVLARLSRARQALVPGSLDARLLLVLAVHAVIVVLAVAVALAVRLAVAVRVVRVRLGARAAARLVVRAAL
mmetsp:Transcript_18383/g.46452  ORF Transcript_18383/g.46452 Transcript_18383/m.46452 type:complete len:737 (-) Transcript_18383:1874-4084(-)